MAPEHYHGQIYLVKEEELARGEFGNSYAWGRLAGLMIDPHLEQAVQETSGDVVVLDVCSAFPYFAQRIRERHLMECNTQAVGILMDFLEALNLPEGESVVGANLYRIRRMISPREFETGNLLKLLEVHEALLRLLYNPLPATIDVKVDDETRCKQLSEWFIAQFQSAASIDDPVTRKKSPYRLSEREKQLRELFGERVEDFLKLLADYFSRKCLPFLRRFFVASLDIKDPQVLLREASRSFPPEYVGSRFFARAASLNQGHLQADIFRLPIGEGRVTFLNCIEGWPFFFPESLVDGKFEPACSIFKILKPRGRAVFFPWHTQGGLGDDELEEIEEYWQSQGAKVTRIAYSIQRLIQVMGPREQELTKISPLFQEGRNLYTLLVLEKC